MRQARASAPFILAALSATSLAGAQDVHTFTRIQLKRSVLERRRRLRRSEQRRRQRHHLRSVVVGRAGVQDAPRVLPGDDDLPVEARADDERSPCRDSKGRSARRTSTRTTSLSLSYDFNHDKWNDILIIGFPGQDTSWFENPKGKDGHWVAPQDLRSDRQRVADVCRPDRRREARAGVHHQGAVRLRRAGLERSGEAVDVPRDLAQQQVRQLHARDGARRRQRRRTPRSPGEGRLVGAAGVARG